jgi:hypothetical protein
MYANVCNVDHAEKMLQENLAHIIFLEFVVYHIIFVLRDLIQPANPLYSDLHPQFAGHADDGGGRVC